MAKVDKSQVITAIITGLAGSIPTFIFRFFDYFQIGKEEPMSKTQELVEPTQRVVESEATFTTGDIFIILGAFLFSSLLGIFVLTMIRKRKNKEE